MKKQQGFTLIELMIVVAIIAILAAIALPAYQDYLRKSRITEVILAASAGRATVAEFVASSPTHACPTANVVATFSSNYVSGVSNNACVISAVSTVPGAEGTITLSGTVDTTAGTVRWVCNSADIAAEFRPGTCQGAASTTGG